MCLGFGLSVSGSVQAHIGLLDSYCCTSNLNPDHIVAHGTSNLNPDHIVAHGTQHGHVFLNGPGDKTESVWF